MSFRGLTPHSLFTAHFAPATTEICNTLLHWSSSYRLLTPSITRLLAYRMKHFFLLHDVDKRHVLDWAHCQLIGTMCDIYKGTFEVTQGYYPDHFISGCELIYWSGRTREFG